LGLLDFTGCASTGMKKYLFFGPPVAEKVEIFEDYWVDTGPFKPDDPNLKLRRGKGGIIRFFKKGNYLRSIMVDGTLTVYVYDGTEDGVELTVPEARLVLDSEQLNKKQRKFDKENGYSYHVWLDLGEYDLPEKEITILSVFTDNKTGEKTASKLIRTSIGGSKKVKVGPNDSQKWASDYVKKHPEILEPPGKQSVIYQSRENDTEEKAKDTVIEVPVEMLRTGQYEPSEDTMMQAVTRRRNEQIAALMTAREQRYDRYQYENENNTDWTNGRRSSLGNNGGNSPAETLDNFQNLLNQRAAEEADSRSSLGQQVENLQTTQSFRKQSEPSTRERKPGSDYQINQSVYQRVPESQVHSSGYQSRPASTTQIPVSEQDALNELFPGESGNLHETQVLLAP